MGRRIPAGVIHLLLFGLVVGAVGTWVYYISRSKVSDLGRTTVLPHLEGQIRSGENLVYCATFQLAWDELRSKSKTDLVQLQDNPPLAEALNRGKFPRSALSEESSVIHMGLVKDGIVDAIKQEMNRKFPGLEYPLAVDSGIVGIAFAFLHKKLPFDTRFEVLPDPLVFHGAAGDIPVRAFGVKEFTFHKDPADWAHQFHVLLYTSPDDFAIKLTPTRDEIVLAKVRPAATLGATLQSVQERIRTGREKMKGQPVLEEKEKVAVPKMALDIRRNYDEILGKQFLNTPWAGLTLGRAWQGIRFTLDESGVKLQSEAMLGWLDGDEGPRQFVLDKPFLLYLKEQKAEEPYLVMWIENA